MKPVDLDTQSGEQNIRVDVCVIGAGPVGLVIARSLSERGLRVALLERGGLDAEAQTHTVDVGFDARPYGGATMGRAYGFGGTSTLWGGQLLPALAHEIDAGDSPEHPAWPVRFAELAPWYAKLDEMLGADRSSFHALQFQTHPLNKLDWGELAPRFSKWLPFTGRNLANAWKANLDKAVGLHSFVHARAVGFEFNARRLQHIEARGGNSRLLVEARHVVLAAGALESTRLALMLFNVPHLRSSKPEALGKYLHDHLSIRMATVQPVNPRALQLLFAPTFIGGAMRTLRMELNPTLARGDPLPPMYAHFVAAAPQHSGFALLRDSLRALQQRRLTGAAQLLAAIPAALPGLCNIALWRATRARLAFPQDAALHLQVDVQQQPEARNRLYLDKDTDSQGCPRLRIDWQTDRSPAAHLERFAGHIDGFWRRNRLHDVARLEWRQVDGGSALGADNLHDIYHPGGTTRMAPDATSGCVDRDLSLFGIDNVSIAGSSVFPRLGAANPTYTAMALALRLADRLSDLRQSGDARRTAA